MSDTLIRPVFSRRIAWGLVLFAALLFFAIHSARLGVSGLIVELAQTELDRWTAAPRPRPMAEFDRVAGYFSDSLDYASDNPWALEGLGALDLARVGVSRDPHAALEFAKAARARYREALRVRPASPYLWANLAIAKLYLDEIDAEFFAALRNADELGPWEPATQQSVVLAGLAAWEKLDSAQRHSIMRAVERGRLRNAEKMFGIVKSYRRFDLVCDLKGYDGVVGPECRKAAKAGKLPGPGAKEKR